MEYSKPTIKSRDYDLSKDWYVEFVLYGETDDRKRYYKGINTFTTIKERQRAAEKLAKDLETKLSEGWRPISKAKIRRTTSSNNSWQSVVKEFLTEVNSNLAPQTLIQYRSILYCFLDWLTDNKRRHDIVHFSRQNAASYRDYMAKKSISNQTINMRIGLLARVYEEAIDKRNIEITNPFKKVQRGKPTATVRKRFTDRDLQLIVDHLEQHDQTLLLLCRLVFSCFLRPHSEARFMKVKWIDFAAESITVPGHISKKIKRTLTVPIPKGKLLDQLMKYRGENPEHYIITLDGIPGEKPVSKNLMSVRFNNIIEKLELDPEYTLYAFKHTGAVKLVDAGVSPKHIQLQMRHSSLEMTDRYLRSMIAMDSDDIRTKSFDL